MPRLTYVAVLSLALFAGCKDEPSAPKKPLGKLKLIPAPVEPAAVEKLVLEKMAAAKAENRTLLVYAGATWCEPCRRFHDAAEKGQLDAEFGDVDVLAFDVDVDNERLAYGNYDSELIPMVALPGPDGKAGEKMSGGVKGDGALNDMVPRLKKLLKR
ncbi:MAG: thioredoxin family protein [Myxococcaceae bacterium]